MKPIENFIRMIFKIYNSQHNITKPIYLFFQNADLKNITLFHLYYIDFLNKRTLKIKDTF